MSKYKIKKVLAKNEGLLLDDKTCDIVISNTGILQVPKHFADEHLEGVTELDLNGIADQAGQQQLIDFFKGCTFYDDADSANDTEKTKFLTEVQQFFDLNADDSNVNAVAASHALSPPRFPWLPLVLTLLSLILLTFSIGLIIAVAAPQLPGIDFFSKILDGMGILPLPDVLVDGASFVDSASFMISALAVPVALGILGIVGLLYGGYKLFFDGSTPPPPNAGTTNSNNAAANAVIQPLKPNDSSEDDNAVLLAGHNKKLNFLQKAKQKILHPNSPPPDSRQGIPMPPDKLSQNTTGIF